MRDPTEWERDGDLDFILDHIKVCACGWDPKVRILGNARAEDIILAIDKVKNERDRLRDERDSAWERGHIAGREKSPSMKENRELRDEIDRLREIIPQAWDAGAKWYCCNKNPCFIDWMKQKGLA